MTRRILLPLILTLSVACDGQDLPLVPNPPAVPTRIIRLGGNLNFGEVIIGQSPPDGLLTVTNDGNANLNVTFMAIPCFGSDMNVIGSTAFAVAPRSTVDVTIRFRPTRIQTCSDPLIVVSDATSGINAITLTASGVVP